jgi:hypothetical protein
MSEQTERNTNRENETYNDLRDSVSLISVLFCKHIYLDTNVTIHHVCTNISSMQISS